MRMETDVRINSLILGYLKDNSFSRAAREFENECRCMKTADTLSFRNGSEHLMPKLQNIIQEYCALKKAENEVLQKRQSTAIYSLWQQFEALTTQLKFLTMGKQSNPFRPSTSARLSASSSYQRVLATITPKIKESEGLVGHGDIVSSFGKEIPQEESTVHRDLLSSTSSSIATESMAGFDGLQKNGALHYDETGEQHLIKSPKRKRIRPKKMGNSDTAKLQLPSNQAAEHLPSRPERKEPAPSDRKAQEESCAFQSSTFPEELNVIFDTLLNSKSLQEKIADNINKVVTSSHLLSPDIKRVKENDSAHPTINVEEVLNMTRSDPSFDSLFAVLDELEISPSAIQTPMKSTDASLQPPVPVYPDFEPIQDGGFSSEHLNDAVIDQSKSSNSTTLYAAANDSGQFDSFTKIHNLDDQREKHPIIVDQNLEDAKRNSESKNSSAGRIPSFRQSQFQTFHSLQSNPVCNIYVKKDRKTRGKPRALKQPSTRDKSDKGRGRSFVLSGPGSMSITKSKGQVNDIWSSEIFPQLNEKKLEFATQKLNCPSKQKHIKEKHASNADTMQDNSQRFKDARENREGSLSVETHLARNRSNEMPASNDIPKDSLGDSGNESSAGKFHIDDILADFAPTESSIGLTGSCKSLPMKAISQCEGKKRKDEETRIPSKGIAECSAITNDHCDKHEHWCKTAPVLSPDKSLCDDVSDEDSSVSSPMRANSLTGIRTTTKEDMATSPAPNIFDKFGDLSDKSRRRGFSVRFDLDVPALKLGERNQESKLKLLDPIDASSSASHFQQRGSDTDCSRYPKKSILKKNRTGNRNNDDCSTLRHDQKVIRSNETNEQRGVTVHEDSKHIEPSSLLGDKLDSRGALKASENVDVDRISFDNVHREINATDKKIKGRGSKRMSIAKYGKIADHSVEIDSYSSKHVDKTFSAVENLTSTSCDLKAVNHKYQKVQPLLSKASRTSDSNPSTSAVPQQIIVTRRHKGKVSAHDTALNMGAADAPASPPCTKKSSDRAKSCQRTNAVLKRLDRSPANRNGDESKGEKTAYVEEAADASHEDHSKEDCINVDVILEETTDGTIAFIKPVGIKDKEKGPEPYVIVKELAANQMVNVGGHDDDNYSKESGYSMKYQEKVTINRKLNESGQIKSVGCERESKAVLGEHEETEVNVPAEHITSVDECLDNHAEGKSLDHSINSDSLIHDSKHCLDTHAIDRCSREDRISTLPFKPLTGSEPMVSDSQSLISLNDKDYCKREKENRNIGSRSGDGNFSHSSQFSKGINVDAQKLVETENGKSASQLNSEEKQIDDSLDGLGFKITSSEVVSDVSNSSNMMSSLKEEYSTKQDNFVIYLSDDSSDSSYKDGLGRSLRAAKTHPENLSASSSSQKLKKSKDVKVTKKDQSSLALDNERKEAVKSSFEDDVDSDDDDENGAKEIERVLYLSNEKMSKVKGQRTRGKPGKTLKPRKRKSACSTNAMQPLKKHQTEEKSPMPIEVLKNLDVDQFLSRLKYSN